MFRNWRFQLREIEQALTDGRLDDAVRRLMDGNLGRYLPGQRLAAKAGVLLADRGSRKQAAGDASGWRDLRAATQLAGETEPILARREEMLERAQAEAERAMAAGDPANAAAQLETLERQGLATDSHRVLMEVARRLDSAGKLSLRGKYGDALAQLDAAGRLRPDLPAIESQRQACRERSERCRELADGLHRVVAEERWGESLVFADRLLELMPESTLAQDARRRAWRALGVTAAEATRAVPATAAIAPQPQGAGQRFLMWVDGVGGYLVCLGEEVTLGQAVPGNPVDIPVLADLSRVHVKIRRDEGYLIEPLGPLRVDGRPVRDPLLLSDGDELELGEGVRLRFRQPHALSATARLEFVSRHRTQPSADGILLMAESCVLGPKWANHVVCRDWSGDVVLYRRDGRLYCRSTEPLEVDGRYGDVQAPLEPPSQITGSDFSLCLELIS